MPRSPYELFLTKFEELTEIQKLSIGHIEQGDNCLITAPTGSGKTEAAILPILNRISKSGSAHGIYAMYVTPLRALNRDLVKRLDWLGSELGISISARHGDTPQYERRKQALKPPQLLITTPETIQNLLMSRSMREALRSLRVVIVDELHELYYNKRGAQLSVALERLEELSRGYQRIGISATIGDTAEASRFLFWGRKHVLIASRASKQLDITVEMPERPAHDRKEFRLSFGLDVQAYARISRVAEIIRQSKAAIVFANTRQAVESLGSKLISLDKLEGLGPVGIHHSSIDKEERIAVENSFKRGATKAIIATSSLELGIDIGSVDVVVQYGSPRQATRLIQRVGRGGHRESAKSKGVIIVHNELDCLESMAIAEAALSLELERRSAERNALDVLANQITAMAIEYGSMSKDRALAIIRRSYTYSELRAEDFERTCSLLSDLRIIKCDRDLISYGPRSRNYFIGSISVIPDSSHFIVREAVENRIISALDQEFVYSNIDEGSVFITKGLPWKVVSIEDDTIIVEPSEDITAAVPDWDGEDIPVSREIALRVWQYMRDGAGSSRASVEKGTMESVSSFVEDNRKFFTLSGSSVTIEELENCAIAYMPTGKQANEFISRMLSIVASSYAGGKVNARSTPYAIILDYSGVIRRPDTPRVFEALKNIDLEDRNFVFDSELFRYKFIQAAKLFGVVERKTAVTKTMASRLASFYESSPISDEASRDLYKNYFDIGSAREFVEGLRSGRIAVQAARRTPSPMSKAILQSVFKYSELLSTPERQTVIEKMFDKFDGRGASMLCTFCGHVFTERIRVNDSSKILCSSCRSPMMVMHRQDYEALVAKRLAHKPFRESDNKLYKEMMKEASLVDAYGYRAIVALSVYGIGIDTAARILKYIRSDYKMFFVDVIDAQKNFIKNRRFWKID